MSGTIDRIASGRYRLRMYVTGKQETIGFYDTEDEAQIAAQAHVKALDETAPDYEGLTLLRYGEAFLTAREKHHRVRDPETDRSRWNNHVKDDLVARVALKKLTSAHVSQWLRRLELKGLAPQTRRNCLNLVRSALAEALSEERVRANVALGLRVKGKSDFVWTYLTLPEQFALLDAMHAERMIVGFALGAGLRAGELVTLRLADVFADPGEERPRVIVRYGTAPDLPTKTGTVRSVPLFGIALLAMRQWLAELPVYCKDNPLGLAFPGQRGAFRSEDHVIKWKAWKAALRKAGITRRFRWHDLRHTCASSLVSGLWGRRWSLEEVKEMLGHTTITITQRYAHLAQGALELAAKGTEGRSSPQVNSSQRGYEWANDLAYDNLRKLLPELALSHPGESDPGPTVYENVALKGKAAGISSIDLSLTCPPSDAACEESGDSEPPLPRSRHRRAVTAPWVIEATRNLAFALARVAR